MKLSVTCVCVCLARVAAAEPVALPPTAYAQLGWQIGSDESESFSAIRGDAGYHLGSTAAWLHAAVAAGSAVGPFLHLPDVGDTHYVSGSLRQVEVGIEGRLCSTPELCGALGIDLGYEQLSYTDNDSTDQTKSVAFRADSVVVVPRVQLDVGGDHIRFRPSIELPIGPHVSATHVMLSLALRI